MIEGKYALLTMKEEHANTEVNLQRTLIEKPTRKTVIPKNEEQGAQALRSVPLIDCGTELCRSRGPGLTSQVFANFAFKNAPGAFCGLNKPYKFLPAGLQSNA